MSRWKAAGAGTLMPRLMDVAIVIGPLLTFGGHESEQIKKAARLDLSIIAILQATASTLSTRRDRCSSWAQSTDWWWWQPIS